MPAAPLREGYVPEIDGLRTVAVLSVLFYHVGCADLRAAMSASTCSSSSAAT